MERIIDKDIIKTTNKLKEIRTLADVLQDKNSLISMYKSIHHSCKIIDSDIENNLHKYDKNSCNKNLKNIKKTLQDIYYIDEEKLINLPLLLENHIENGYYIDTNKNKFIISSLSNRVGLDILQYTTRYIYETLGNKAKVWDNRYAEFIDNNASKYFYRSKKWLQLYNNPTLIYTGLQLGNLTPDNKINICSINFLTDLNTDIDEFYKNQYYRLSVMDYTKLYNDVRITDRNLIGYIVPNYLTKDSKYITVTSFEKVIDPNIYEYVNDEISSKDVDKYLSFIKDLTSSSYHTYGMLPMFMTIDNTPLLYSNLKTITYPIHPLNIYNYLTEYVFSNIDELYKLLSPEIIFIYNPYLRKTPHNKMIGLEKRYFLDNDFITETMCYETVFSKHFTRSIATEIFNIVSYITYTERYIFSYTKTSISDIKRIFNIKKETIIKNLIDIFHLEIDLNVDVKEFNTLDTKIINLIKEFKEGYNIAINYLHSNLKYFMLLGFSLEYLFNYMLNYNRRGIVFIPKQNSLYNTNFRELISKAWKIPSINIDYELSQPCLEKYLNNISQVYIEDTELEHKYLENDILGYINNIVNDDNIKFGNNRVFIAITQEPEYKEWTYRMSHQVDINIVKSMFIIYQSLERRYDTIYHRLTKARKERKDITDEIIQHLNNILKTTRLIIELDSKQSVNKHLINLNNDIRSVEVLTNSCIGQNNISYFVKNDISRYFSNLSYLSRALIRYSKK